VRGVVGGEVANDAGDGDLSDAGAQRA
jgi:hypothetical protein